MSDLAPTPPTGATKTCPACAEQVQQAAQVCRFCGYDFTTGARPVPVAPGGGETNGKAIASLVFGILWLFGLGSLLAVILGHMAKKEIDRSEGRQSGRGIAVAGLILGWLGVAGFIGFILLTAGLFAATEATIDNTMRSELEITLKKAATAQEVTLTENGQYTASENELLEAADFDLGLADLRVVRADAEGYCLEAELSEDLMHFDSTHGAPEEGGCWRNHTRDQ